jgi:S-adenosylmethionine hydrolase
VYGNLCSGIRAAKVDRESTIRAGNHTLRFARTFCDVPVGTAFWYENAFGLIELAVNQGRADHNLGLSIGDRVALVS